MSHVKGKKERALVGRLHDKIVEDLKHDHGEARETMMRKAGFWRWASRKAYNRLAEDGRIWDWKSGEALAPVVEHEGDVVVDPHGPAAAEEMTVDGEGAARDGPLVNKDDEVNDDDLLSVASLTSEGSSLRPTYASSTSRDTSMSSASRTTFSSNE